MKELSQSVKFDISNSNVLITDVSSCAKIFELMERILFKRACLWNVWFTQGRKMWIVDLILLP